MHNNKNNKINNNRKKKQSITHINGIFLVKYYFFAFKVWLPGAVISSNESYVSCFGTSRKNEKILNLLYFIHHHESEDIL